VKSLLKKLNYRDATFISNEINQILLRKGFRDTNNLMTDIFLKQKRNLKNSGVSLTLMHGLHFDDFKLWTAIHAVKYRSFKMTH